MNKRTRNRRGRLPGAISKPEQGKKVKGLKTAAQAVTITVVYFAGIAILLWPAVDAARLG